MSIVTKTGDRGSTSLCCGTRVPKDDIRVEICGALDEVSSFLGMAKSSTKDKKTINLAERIQKELSLLCSEVATTPAGAGRLKKVLSPSSIVALEKEIEGLERGCDIKVRRFCLQGANIVSSALDVARAITRSAERRCVTMSKKKMLKNSSILVYLNRLSDLLFLLARYNEKGK